MVDGYFFKMMSIVRRSSTLAQNVFKEGSKVTPHVYEQPPVSNFEELNRYFLNNIIYNKKGLILLNKPYGLQKESTEFHENKRKEHLITKNPVVDQLDRLSFAGILPVLSNELRLKELNLIKVPERYISGVSVLSTPEAAQSVQKGLAQPSELAFTYLAICIGIPIELSGFCRLGLTLKERHGKKKAVFVDKFSNSSLKQQLVVPIRMRYTTLATNDSLKVSLVRLQNNRNKWHALRAFCALRLLAPILGDKFYGSCVRTVYERAMPIDPLSPLANFPCKLPRPLSRALELKPENNTIIPSHLHLSGVHLGKCEPNKIFVAKLPDYFLWTCQKLNLTVPELYLKNSVVEKSDYFGVPSVSTNE